MSQILAPNLHPSFLQSSLRSLTTYAAVVASPEGLRFCCEKLFSSQSPQVKFFCLQVLTDVAKNRYLQAFALHLTSPSPVLMLLPSCNRYATLAPPEKTGLREVLIKWIREHLVQHQDEQAGTVSSCGSVANR